MTKDDIKRCVGEFAAAARRVDCIGYDVIELHGGHGYLLHQFMSPISNQRTDAYGGSTENRIRFPIEVYRAVRAVCPSRSHWASVAELVKRESGITTMTVGLIAGYQQAENMWRPAKPT